VERSVLFVTQAWHRAQAKWLPGRGSKGKMANELGGPCQLPQCSAEGLLPVKANASGKVGGGGDLRAVAPRYTGSVVDTARRSSCHLGCADAERSPSRCRLGHTRCSHWVC